LRATLVFVDLAALLTILSLYPTPFSSENMTESSNQAEVQQEVADELYREGSFVNGSGHKIFTQAWVPAQPKCVLIFRVFLLTFEGNLSLFFHSDSV
jgi:hypothetical protein